MYAFFAVNLAARPLLHTTSFPYTQRATRASFINTALRYAPSTAGMPPPPTPPPFRLSSIAPKPLPPGYRVAQYATDRLGSSRPPSTRFDYLSEDLGEILQNTSPAIVRIALAALKERPNPKPVTQAASIRIAAVSRTLLETALARSKRPRSDADRLHPRIAARAHAGLYNIYVDIAWNAEAELSARTAIALLSGGLEVQEIRKNHRTTGASGSSSNAARNITRPGVGYTFDADEEDLLYESPSDAALLADLSTALAATILRNDAEGDVVARAQRIIPLLRDSLEARQIAARDSPEGVLEDLHGWSANVRMLADACADAGDVVQAYELYEQLLHYLPDKRLSHVAGKNFLLVYGADEDNEELERRRKNRRYRRHRRRVREARQMPSTLGDSSGSSSASSNDDGHGNGARSEGSSEDDEDATPEALENTRLRRRAAAVRRVRSNLQYRMAMLILQHQLSTSTIPSSTAVPSVAGVHRTSSFTNYGSAADSSPELSSVSSAPRATADTERKMTIDQAFSLLETCCKVQEMEKDPALWWNSVTAVRGLLHGSLGQSKREKKSLRKAVHFLEDALASCPRAWRDDPFEVSEIRLALNRARRELRALP